MRGARPSRRASSKTFCMKELAMRIRLMESGPSSVMRHPRSMLVVGACLRSDRYHHLLNAMIVYNMKIAIDQYSYVVIAPEVGGRVVELVLLGRTVIKGEKPYCDTSTGSFLMFPWVSKAPENPYGPLKDQYHGFSINTLRQVEVERIANDEFKIAIKEAQQHEDRHSFIEIFTLRRGSLSIAFKVIENQQDKSPFCFGYHPYLQIDEQPLDELTVETDINTLLQFDEQVLPIYPFKQRQISISSKGSYNNLFKGGKYVRLISKDVTVSIESDLPYWQIYTPASRKTIAIEPVSFCGNLYNISSKDKDIVLQKSGKIVISVKENLLA